MTTEHLLVSGHSEEEIYQTKVYLHGLCYRFHKNNYFEVVVKRITDTFLQKFRISFKVLLLLGWGGAIQKKLDKRSDEARNNADTPKYGLSKTYTPNENKHTTAAPFVNSCKMSIRRGFS
jgi:hypothetical protein